MDAEAKNQKNEKPRFYKKEEKEYLVTTQEEIMDVLTLIRHTSFSQTDNSLLQLQKRINEVVALVQSQVSSMGYWEKWFLTTGALVFNMLDNFEKEFAIFAQFLLQKHLRYTAKPLRRWKQTGIIIRMDSKVTRLTCLTEQETNGFYEVESIEDTTKDLLGYCVLGYLLTLEIKQRKE